MFDTHNQTINVPKKDLLSIVAEVKPGSLNGCQFCRKTILWNGGTWAHVNDEPQCEGIKCKPEWTKDTEEVLVGYTGFFTQRPKMEPAPIVECSRCHDRRPADKSEGEWQSFMGYSDCKGAVATPIGVGAT